MSEVQAAYERCGQARSPAFDLWRPRMGHTSSLNDIFSISTHQYLPHLVDHNIHNDGSAFAIWQIRFVSDRPLFKSRIAVLMMCNGWVDQKYERQVVSPEADLHSMDVIFKDVLLRKRKRVWKEVSIRRPENTWSASSWVLEAVERSSGPSSISSTIVGKPIH